MDFFLKSKNIIDLFGAGLAWRSIRVQLVYILCKPIKTLTPEKDVEEFKKAAADNGNTKVKDFATSTLPVLQAHLEKAKSIRDKMR